MKNIKSAYLEEVDEKNSDIFLIKEFLGDLEATIQSLDLTPGWNPVCRIKNDSVSLETLAKDFFAAKSVEAVVVDGAIFLFQKEKVKTKSVELDDYSELEKRLCEVLAEKIRANEYTVKNPLTKAWLQSSRRLIARAKELGADEEKIVRLMDWATNDPFWRNNIRSMPKFEEKYEVLRNTAIEQAKIAKAKENTVSRNRLTTHRDIAERGISAAFDPSNATKMMS